jgi:hypothetical protein
VTDINRGKVQRQRLLLLLLWSSGAMAATAVWLAATPRLHKRQQPLVDVV